ncbi:16870_t:CDS:2 [Gigaspora margarita]|uniref:DNA 3'-5' helicase n=1 Tax=Gigaspora margarita TaxID=4874 RepID=A0ABN7V3W2_GIGMA|nr:16870_t:CDS:2 [Gigaspora margarita]
MGILAAKIYATLDQPLEEQEKIFGEVVAGITKVLSAWAKLGQIKEEFPLSPILLLITTCFCEGVSRLSIILKDHLKVIQKCIEIFNGLKEYVDSNHLGIYYRKMYSADQKTTLNLWNQQKLKYIVAMNTFGIGVHISDIRIIIHTTFLLSSTNFVQEVGRASRDEKQAKSIVLYSCSDIRELLLIVGRRIDSEDLIQILDMVNKLLEFSNDPTISLVNFGCDDIVDVFMKANNKNTREKNLTFLWENDRDKAKSNIIRTRNTCLHAIDQLCIKELLVQNVVIKPVRPGSSMIVYSSNFSEIASDARQKILENS